MPKVHMSQKKVYNTWKKTYWVGYCQLQHLLRFKDPEGFNAGVYNWNCDFYLFPHLDIAIATGYRFRKSLPSIPWELCKKYDKQAEAVLCENIPNADKNIRLFEMFEEMIKEFENA